MTLEQGKMPMPRAKQAKRYGMLEQDAISPAHEALDDLNDLEAPDQAEPLEVEEKSPLTRKIPAKPCARRPRNTQRERTAQDAVRLVEPEAPSCPATPSLSAGTRIRVHGLKSAAHHNGKHGMVVGMHEGSSDRHKVRLDSGEIVALKVANLTVSSPAPDFYAMIGALERAGEHDKAALLRRSLPPPTDLE